MDLLRVGIGVVSWVVPGFSEERELGHGASGRVVAAVRAATGERVAVKYLSPRLLGDPRFVAAFRAEAALLQSLDVPYVVRLLEYVEAPGHGAAIVMELVEGTSLHEMITRQGPASPEAALLVLKGSLLGLAAAHRLGIVHRDYKPENVLVDGAGQSKLSDFGVAVRAGRDAGVGGTPLYMAPEQWNGLPASPATDIYAATAVFFECLTGTTPFSGPLGQLAALHAAAAVPAGLVDEPLRELITRGMAKDPADRPADATAFITDLDSAATAAYGADWEDRGRGHLAARAAALLLLLLPHAGAATGAGTGTTAASTSLPATGAARTGRAAARTGRAAAKTATRAGRVGSRAWLYAGVAAAVIGVAAGSLAAVALSSGHGGSAHHTLKAGSATPMRWTPAEAAVPSDAQTSSTSTSKIAQIDQLYGVFCPPGGIACTAVGSYTRQSEGSALVEVISPGKATQAQASFPLPANSAAHTENDLDAIVCFAAADCLAAGTYSTGQIISLAQGVTENVGAGVAENLSGATWRAWPLGSDASARDPQIAIQGLACPVPAKCIAVGFYYADTAAVALTVADSRPAVLTIAGSSSTPVRVPLPADARPSGGLSSLYSLACTSPVSCVAVGSYTDTHGRNQGLIETLERGSWTPATAALPADAAAGQKAYLYGIACTAPGSCIAVGTYTGPGGATESLVETIKDGRLSGERAPGLAGKPGGELNAIACPGPSTCVAVGEYATADKSVPVIENLSGTAWAESSPALPANASKATQPVYLNAVSCASTTYCVAVGGYTNNRKLLEGLIESTATAAP
jgi:hypothetical protein